MILAATTTLVTSRLMLRPLEMGDAPALFAILGDAQAMEFWHRPALPRMTTVEALLADEIAAMAAGGFLYWTVLQDGKAIGGVDLSYIADANAWIGFLFRRDVWGRGYAREALGAVISHAFGSLRLSHLAARIQPANLRAARLLDRVGFQREGVLPDVLWGTERRGALRYVLNKSESAKGA